MGTFWLLLIGLNVKFQSMCQTRLGGQKKRLTPPFSEKIGWQCLFFIIEHQGGGGMIGDME